MQNITNMLHSDHYLHVGVFILYNSVKLTFSFTYMYNLEDVHTMHEHSEHMVYAKCITNSITENRLLMPISLQAQSYQNVMIKVSKSTLCD